jgi:hypothetical protein
MEIDNETLARGVFMSPTPSQMKRLKSIHVVRRLHEGMLTIRVFFVNVTKEDPEPSIFTREDLMR